MAKFALWYGMFQYIRSVWFEYVVRISSVTSLYIGHWRVFENISLADRQTDRQTDRFAFTKTETQFYKLRIFLDQYRGTMIPLISPSVHPQTTTKHQSASMTHQ